METLNETGQQARVPYEITGPMGRATLRLPCQHMRSSLKDMHGNGTYGPARRTCAHCRTRYTIIITAGQVTAQVTWQSPATEQQQEKQP